jgi:hypothetical protein
MNRWTALMFSAGLTLTLSCIQGCSGADASPETRDEDPPPVGDKSSNGAPDSTSGGEESMPAGEAGPVPQFVKAFVGGTSVALRWDERGARDIAEYKVLRDGVAIATVKPGFHQDFPEKYGNGYIDKAVTPGTSYRYQVQATGTDGKTSEPSAALSVTHPATTTPVPTITLDSSKAPDLASWLENSVRPFLYIWYPKVSDLLARPEYSPPASFTVRIDPAYDGVAYASGPLIVMSAKYARDNPRDLGAFIHESTHVLQGYSQTPGWITEGIADWTREYMVHDRDPYPLRPSQTYTQGYSQGSYFLNWIQAKYDHNFIHKVNAAGHKSAYADSLFTQASQKTITQLATEMRAATIAGPSAIQLSGGKCLDTTQPAACTSAAKWSVVRSEDGWLNLVTGTDSCIAVKSSGTTTGSPIGTSGCNAGDTQKWVATADNKLQNPHSGRCLGAASDGTKLELRDCDDSASLSVTLPK